MTKDNFCSCQTSIHSHPVKSFKKLRILRNRNGRWRWIDGNFCPLSFINEKQKDMFSRRWWKRIVRRRAPSLLCQYRNASISWVLQQWKSIYSFPQLWWFLHPTAAPHPNASSQDVPKGVTWGCSEEEEPGKLSQLQGKAERQKVENSS